MRNLVARWRRPIAIFGLAAALLAPVVVDRLVGRTTETPRVRIASANPAASPLGSGASTWFCASGRTTSENLPDLTVTIANLNDIEVPGRITWYSEEIGREPIVEPLLAGGNSRVDVAAPSSVAGGAIAALVEFDAGGVAAEHRISGPFGGASALCSSDAGARWITADGATTIDATTTLSVFNPFPEDALLDVRLVTDRGTALPAALQGVSIAAQSVQQIDVGSFVRRRNRVAAIVRARIGRVVVERITTFDGSGTEKGMTISPATATAGPTWYFASGRTSSVLRERYALFNPTRQTVTAVIDVLIDGVAGVEPFEIDIPPMDVAELIPGSESRVARNTGYSVVVTTDDGSDIVVERTVDARGKFRRGFASSPGIVAPAETWIIPDVESSATRSDTLSLLNPTDANAVVSLRTLGPDGSTPVRTAQDFVIGPSSRLDLRVGDYVAVTGRSLVLSSPGTPIIVERTIQFIARPGDRPFVDPLPTEDSISAASDTVVPGTLPPLPPDSLAADSLAPDSLAPDSLAPGSLTLVSPSPTTIRGRATGVPSTSTSLPPTAVAVRATPTPTSTQPSPTTRTGPTTTRANGLPASTTPSTTASKTASTTASTSASTSASTTPASTTTASTTEPTTEPTVPELRSRAASPRIGTARIGTSVGGAIPLR